MSDAGTTSQGRDAPATGGRRRALGVALWALRILLAVQFAFAGVLKVTGDPAMVEMFATIGLGQWFRYLVGATVTNVFGLGTSPLAPLVALLMGALVA